MFVTGKDSGILVIDYDVLDPTREDHKIDGIEFHEDFT